MNILFYSHDLLGGNVARRLIEEGNEVRMFIEDEDKKNCLNGLVPKINEWETSLSWVGKEGLIVFDDNGNGSLQDYLRLQGYNVFGGCTVADTIEYDREYSTKLFREHSIDTLPLHDFHTLDEAIRFVEENACAWVIKRNDGDIKMITHIPYFSDGRDSLELLKLYKEKGYNNSHITLQKKIEGVEMGVGRYFNGNDWIGPIEFNIEYTKFFPHELGPVTSEMGTLGWFSSNYENSLYKSTLEKLTEYLRSIHFRGDFEINFMVNKHGAYPLEPTPRFGSPIVHLHTELFKTSWTDLLSTIAKGEQKEIEWNEGFGIVLTLAIPPFPYSKKMDKEVYEGVPIYFDNLSDADMDHVHFEEVLHDCNMYRVAGGHGYMLYTTSHAPTIEEAREKVYSLSEKIIIPKLFYRTDIGEHFEENTLPHLLQWGYLSLDDLPFNGKFLKR